MHRKYLRSVRGHANYRTWRHAGRLADGLRQMRRPEDRQVVIRALLKTLKAALEGR